MKINPSHPDFEKYKNMVQAIHLAANPHIYFNGYVEDDLTNEKKLEMSDVQLMSLRETLDEAMKQLIKDFEYDFIDVYQVLPGEFEQFVKNLEEEVIKPGDIDLGIFGLLE
jgi:hypothetical protein